jgi:hypothetical protein
MIAIKIIIIFLLADFGTGIFHFGVDTYGKMNGSIMTNSVNFLLVHHHDPTAILELSYWELTRGVYKVSIILFPLSLIIGFHWELVLFLLFSANGNMIHKWAHLSDAHNTKLVNYLQGMRIIQSPKQHLKHHNGSFNQNFCVMSNLVNPILTRLDFWQGVIFVLKRFGIKPHNRRTPKFPQTINGR